MPIFLILVLILQLVAGVRLGAALRRKQAVASILVASGVFLYVVLCIVLATLAVLYPGPDSEHAAGSAGSLVRRIIIGPSQWLWLIGPMVVAFSVAYARAGKLYAEGQQISTLWKIHSVLISILFLPFWLGGLVIHMSYFAGTWF